MSILRTSFDDPDGKLSPQQMLAIAGPTILVRVGVPNPPDAAGKLKAPEEQVSALIDTGADSSCIDEKLAKYLKLPIIDRKKVGAYRARKYTTSIWRTYSFLNLADKTWDPLSVSSWVVSKQSLWAETSFAVRFLYMTVALAKLRFAPK